MPQAIGDPDELDRFAQSLTQFIDTLNEAVNGLNHSFGALGDTWQDEKRASFEEDYNALVQQLSHFEANASEQVPYLHVLSFEAEPLSVTLVNRPSSNLLISGYNDAIHDGLLASILQSLNVQDSVNEVIYFNGRSIEPMGASKYLDGSRDTPVLKYESVNSLNLTGIADELQQSKRILIIEGLDSTKEFHSGPASFRQVKKDEPLSPQESIKNILEDGPLQGTFVIAFADNWKRCNSSCKDLLGFFEMRVGFCMIEDDAGSFVSGAIGKFKGLETDNRAVFTDRLKNQVSWFRPYINVKSL